jgi:hypothetical protein
MNEENKTLGTDSIGDNVLTFEDVKNYIESNYEKQDIQDFFSSKFKNYVDTDRGRELIQPTLDRYVSKGIETFKAKTLPTIIDEEVTKRMPAETPEQRRIRELEDKLNNQEKDSFKKDLKNNAMKLLNEKGLPTILADYLNGDTIEGIRHCINNLEVEWTLGLEDKVNNKLKSLGKTPTTKQLDNKEGLTKELLLKMPLSESTKIYNENPVLWKQIMSN